MRATTWDVDPADANLTGYASNVTGAAFTITTNDSGDSLAHRVSIRNDTGNSHAGKTVTLVGTDANGKVISDVVTGPGPSATVESDLYFLTLTSATPSATIGSDTFDIGWVDEVVTALFPLNWRSDTPATYAIQSSSGTFVAAIEETYQDFNRPSETIAPSNVVWVPVWNGEQGTPGQTSSADVSVGIHANATGARLRLDSYSAGAELTFSISHGRS
jgi:hypothetical protein